MRSDRPKAEGIHYFHYYAVADRIDFSVLSDQWLPTRQKDARQLAACLLPSPDD